MSLSGPFAAGIGDGELEAELATELAQVEALLLASVASEDPFVSDVAKHLVDAGGKRFRPLLVLLAAQFGDPASPGVIPAAVVVELTHLATLYHDDVMDEAPLRRGGPSANARWDNTVAILTGDFLFARASHILADLGPEAVRIQAETFERLVAGQIHETIGPVEGQDPLDHYLQVVADKTGSLIATSGRFGAMLSGAGDQVASVLTEFGERIGVAFQLSDDLLDVLSDSAESGKTPGTDLREGVATLPALHVRRAAAPEDARLLELLGRAVNDDAEHAEALALVRAHPAIELARADLAQLAAEARRLLDALPDVPARHALASLCDVVVTRTT